MLEFDGKNQKPLREMVYDYLKMLIITGEIPPGTRMMEVGLAEKLDVSRTPIREAIRKLEKEGLVKIETRRGAYASEITTKDMIEILEVRQDLEGLAAGFAASRMTDEELAELEQVSNQYDKAVEDGDTSDMIRLDTRFHRLIVDSCENRILVRMIEQLQELVLRFRYIYYDDFKRAEKMPAEHAQIIAGIKSRDAGQARQAADIHVQRLKEMVKSEGVLKKKEMQAEAGENAAG